MARYRRQRQPVFNKPLFSSEDWRQSPLRSSLSVAPRFLWECLTSRTVSRFPALPRQTQRADFPPRGLLLASSQGLCDLSCWNGFQHYLRSPDPALLEQPEFLVELSPAPLLPAGALPLPGASHAGTHPWDRFRIRHRGLIPAPGTFSGFRPPVQSHR